MSNMWSTETSTLSGGKGRVEVALENFQLTTCLALLKNKMSQAIRLNQHETRKQQSQQNMNLNQ